MAESRSHVCTPSFAADPDIAGIGVMIAFNLSAFLTTATALIASGLHNDISLPFAGRLSVDRRSFWTAVLDRLILGLSDQQLVTGISILLIGFFKLPHNISTYHFGLITSLGMFSCSAHLASVISLRRYFQSNHEVAKIRIGLMLIFAILLAASLVAIGVPINWTRLWRPNPQLLCPARYTIVHNESSWRVIGILFAVYLFACYWAALSYVFPDAEIFFTTWLLTKPLETIEALLSLHGLHEDFMHWRPRFPSLALSHLLQFLWWIGSFATSLIIRRSQSAVSEETWGFGQILAVLLIGIPFLNAAEAYFEQQRHRRNEELARELTPSAAATPMEETSEMIRQVSQGAINGRVRRVDTEQAIEGVMSITPISANGHGDISDQAIPQRRTTSEFQDA